MADTGAQSGHLRVLLANKFFTPVGGPETLMVEMSRMLEENGHSVVHFAMQHPDNLPSPYCKYFVSGVDYNKSGGIRQALSDARNIIYSQEAARKMRDLVQETHPDIAHLHNIYHQLSPSILTALKREGIPTVLTLHDAKLLCPNYLFYRGVICESCGGRRFYNAVLHKCVKGSLVKSMLCTIEMYIHTTLGLYDKNVDLFIAPSEFLKGKFLEYKRLPAERIIHVPNAINLDTYAPSYANEGYCVFVGRVGEYKGIMTLVKAMRANPTTKLRVVGKGEDLPKVEAFIKEHGMDNVTFDGFQTGEALRNIVKGASFVIVPSECYENCPMSVLEGFAHGKPVIGSRLGGIPEIIDDGVNGLLFEAGNAEDLAEKISRLASHPELLPEMGKAAREKAESRYSPQAHFTKLLEVYRQAIEMRRNS